MRKFKIFSLAAVAVLIFSVFACSEEKDNSESKAPFKGGVTVKRSSPAEITSANQPLSLKFSSPMVGEDKINKPMAIEDSPLFISPALEGEVKWLDESTLSFEPFKPYAPATRYSVQVSPELRDARGEQAVSSVSFATPALTLKQVRELEYSKEGKLVLSLEFNLPVDPVEFKKYMELRSENEREQAELAYTVREGVASETLTLEALVPAGKVLRYSLRAGLPTVAGPLGLETGDTAEIKSSPGSTESKPVDAFKPEALTISSVSTSVWGGAASASVYASTSFLPGDLAKFISLAPKVKFNAASSYGSLTLSGDFKFGERYQLTFKKGLPAQNGAVLQEDYTTVLAFPDAMPLIEIAGQKSGYLSPGNGGRLGVELLNIKDVSLKLWRLYENNIVVGMGQSGVIDPYSVSLDLSRRVAVQDVSLTSLKNEKIKKSIDLSALAGKERGVFLLTLQGQPMRLKDSASDDYYAYNSKIYASCAVVLTDLGISARVYDQSLLVWVNSIAGGQAVQGAEVAVYSLSNQLLARGKTDAQGVMRLKRDAPWEDQLAPGVIVVKTADDLSFVSLRNNIFADSTFDIGGKPYFTEGYEAFVYTPRGVFRPGEQVDVKAIVRGANRSMVEPFPLVWKIFSATGNSFAEGTTQLSKEGGAFFNVALPASAPTGKYSADIFVPGQEDQPIGRCAFDVEEISPPRIEVSLRADKAFLQAKQELNVQVQAQYLFGAPGDSLRFEADVQGKPAVFTSPDWQAYTFGDGEVAFEPVKEDTLKDLLNAQGKGSFKYTPGFDAKIPGPLDLSLVVRVQEDGGRWVNQILNVPFYPAPYVLGLEKAKNDSGFTFGNDKDVVLQVAAVTPEGKPANPGKLEAEIQEVITHYNWVRDYEDGSNVSRWKRTEEFVDFARVPVTVNKGVGVVRFKPGKEFWATYRVRVSSPQTGASTSARVNVADASMVGSGQGSGMLNRIVMKLDKALYKPGEEAKVTLRAPFLGRLYLNVETDHEIWSDIVELKSSQASFTVPVNAAMQPNAYVTAVLLRPVETGEQWSPHRAVGIVPLKLDMEFARLNVQIENPAQVMPDGQVPVKVSIKDNAGRPVQAEFSLALVDEGVLSLTAFNTPSPLEFFVSQRKLASRDFDVYDELLAPELKSVELLSPGGDSGQEAMFLSAIGRKIQLLSLFEPALSTNAEGQAEYVFKLPEYSGKARIMLVAASGDAFGNGQNEVSIARDVVVEATLPNAVGPGDKFYVPVKAFKAGVARQPDAGGGKERVAEIKAVVSGPLELRGDTSFSLDLNDPALDFAKLDLQAVAQNATGEGTLVLQTTVPGDANNSFSQSFNLPVRPANPRVSMSASGKLQAGSNSLELNLAADIVNSALPGSLEGQIAISASPQANLMPALSFLQSYPYGCLEQTVSTAWPYLVMPDIMEQAGFISKKKAGKESGQKAGTNPAAPFLESIVARVASMQLWDGSFSSWPGGGATDPWSSLYATHFLLESSKIVSVPEGVLGRALDWTRSYLAFTPGANAFFGVQPSYTAKAYACYILALKGEPPFAWMQHLTENSRKMYPSGQILLAGAKALAAGNASPLQALQLKDNTQSDGYNSTLESQTRNNALLLLIWSAVEPRATEAAELALALEQEATTGLRTTQEAGLTVFALGRYLEKTAEERKKYTANVLWGNKSVAKGSEAKALVVNDLGKLLSEKTPDKEEQLTVQIDGAGRPYYAWTMSAVPLLAPKAHSNGLELKRQWADADDKVIDLPDGSAKPPVPVLALGQRVFVTLTLTPAKPMRDVVVVDVLAGGLQVENPRLIGGSGFEDGAALSESDQGENTDNSDTNMPKENVRLDLRDDRLVLIVDYLEKPLTYTYSLRAITRGVFALPPVAAEGMYAPQINALTSAGQIEIK